MFMALPFCKSLKQVQSQLYGHMTEKRSQATKSSNVQQKTWLPLGYLWLFIARFGFSNKMIIVIICTKDPSSRTVLGSYVKHFAPWKANVHLPVSVLFKVKLALNCFLMCPFHGYDIFKILRELSWLEAI